MKLANVKNQEYTKEMFKDIAIFTLAEPGAMGMGNLMEFITAEGKEFSLFFSEEMPYSKVKELFPALDNCYWNGPELGESCRTEFVFYADRDETSSTQSHRKIIHTYMRALAITYAYETIIILWSNRSYETLLKRMSL